jgi:hypothetical protein
LTADRLTAKVVEGEMNAKRPPIVLAALITALLLLAASAADANVGIQKTSRHAGTPGSRVTLTLACGFCFPPCVGPKGERHPKGAEHGPCMLGTKEDPPGWFGVSLVPISRAPQRHSCGTGVCVPELLGPPHRAPYTYLGRAVPPAGGNDPEGGGPPRYLLHFRIPHLRAGTYTYEIWCDACVAGRRGALIGAPRSRPWRLTVRPAGGRAG